MLHGSDEARVHFILEEGHPHCGDSVKAVRTIKPAIALLAPRAQDCLHRHKGRAGVSPHSDDIPPKSTSPSATLVIPSTSSGSGHPPQIVRASDFLHHGTTCETRRIPSVVSPRMSCKSRSLLPEPGCDVPFVCPSELSSRHDLTRAGNGSSWTRTSERVSWVRSRSTLAAAFYKVGRISCEEGEVSCGGFSARVVLHLKDIPDLRRQPYMTLILWKMFGSFVSIENESGFWNSRMFNVSRREKFSKISTVKWC